MIHAFKYRRHRALADPLAALMRTAAGDVLLGADAVVPVPLHPWRAAIRGFNQADDLASRLDLPVWRVLRRRRLEHPQSQSSAERRRLNVQHAFGLNLRQKWTPLAGRTLILVDDVMTTGETLEACSAVLLEAGVRAVRAVTVARAVVGPLRRPRPRQPLSTARRR
jgi:ComF family protein